MTYFSTRQCFLYENILTNKEEMTNFIPNYRLNVHYATAITTGSASQRPNTLCTSIWMWIDVTFRGIENSYSQTLFYPPRYNMLLGDSS